MRRFFDIKTSYDGRFHVLANIDVLDFEPASAFQLETSTDLPSDFRFYYDDSDLYADPNALKISLSQPDPGSGVTSLDFIPTDPLFSNQWFLHNTVPGEFDINVTRVWDDYTGNGVQVVVMDTGSDYNHQDLAANYLSDLDYDYLSNDFDPAAPNGENHGTAVMGIIAAVQGNNEGGVGVAFDASLINYRGFGIGASYGDEMFLDAAGLGDGFGNTNGDGNGSDVISMSGGLGSNVFLTNSNYDDAIAALDTITANGRDGLGTIFVKSSGNSRANPGSTAREEGTVERYDSTEFSINAAALRADGWVTDYSTPGANVLVAAFADDVNNFGDIFTTDRLGSNGYSNTDYTSNFSGTSAAAPQIAGVVALMLEANPELGWRDVQKILAMSARQTGSEMGTTANTGSASNGGHEQATQLDGSTWFWNAADSWNGGGLHFSNDYGYGLVDALAAVRLAESWSMQSTSANRVFTEEDDFNTTISLDDASQTFIISETDDINIEHVSIELDFETTFLADMEIYLVSPGGTRVQLIADTGDSGNYNGRWTFGTVAFMGESSAGNWQLILVDDDSGEALTVRDAVLRTSGSSSTDDDLFVLTNEFSDYAGVAGHVTNFVGGTGANTLNAAAVTLASTVNLVTGTGTIDGVGITFSDIQHVVTGDGDDVITGSDADETIFSGRGDDMIDGGNGTDYALYSGNIADYTVTDNLDGTYTIFRAGEGTDTLTNVEWARFADGDVGLAPSGPDTFTNGDDIGQGTNGDDLLDGLDGNDRIDGLAGDDTIIGGNGNDILIGGLGADQIDGGNGFDTLLFEGSGRVIVRLWNGTGLLNDAAGDTYANIENVTTGSGNDTVIGDAGRNVFRTNDGDDVLNGLAGNDILIGGAGADTYDGGDGIDTLIIGGADNVVVRLSTGEGRFGDAEGDTYANIENVRTGNGDDLISGTDARNIIRGFGGDDNLLGNGGDDRLVGGQGDDVLTGGTGADQLFGGGGSDLFVVAGAHGHDRIYDFNTVQDVVDLKNTTFTDFASIQAAITDFGTYSVLTVNVNTSIRFDNLLSADFSAANFTLNGVASSGSQNSSTLSADTGVSPEPLSAAEDTLHDFDDMFDVSNPESALLNGVFEVWHQWDGAYKFVLDMSSISDMFEFDTYDLF